MTPCNGGTAATGARPGAAEGAERTEVAGVAMLPAANEEVSLDEATAEGARLEATTFEGEVIGGA
jgi:hypothetical protein